MMNFVNLGGDLRWLADSLIEYVSVSRSWQALSELITNINIININTQTSLLDTTLPNEQYISASLPFHAS
jgi:hypothetical protein